MEKITDITKIKEKTQNTASDGAENQTAKDFKKSTNPIFKKLAQFKNDNISKKFDINDLLR